MNKMNEMDDVVKEFLVESYENLDQLDRELVELEKAPSDRDILSNIFRTIHTIKGTCGFLAFTKLESVTHVGENLLSRLRDGVLTLTPEITTVLLEMVDAVRQILSNIETTGKEGDGDYSALIEKVTRLQGAGAPPAPASAASPRGPSDGAKSRPDSLFARLGGGKAVAVAVEKFYQRLLADPQLQSFFANTNLPLLKTKQILFLTQALGGPRAYKGRAMKEAHAHLPIEQRHFDLVAGHLVASLESLGVPKPLIDEAVAVVAPLASDIVNTPTSEPQPSQQPAIITSSEHSGLTDLLLDQGKVRPEDVRRAAQAQAAGDPRRIGEILVEQGALQPQDVLAALQKLQAQAGPRGSGVSETNIRVDVSLLDKLMNLVGELVLARNQILQFTTTLKDSSFVATSQRLNLITTELQEGVMKTRMQPIGNVWGKLPRVLRDLAAACGKKIRIEMEGKETELDKTIIEAIKDPLTHLVRNSADHGIEDPERRLAAGKPAEGVISLRAYHEGGQVNIEISDDGLGIDPERIKRKAVERGLITPEQAARMSEREAVHVTFLPGFSTTEKVTNVSGRGVGMDVVKTNIERIGGTVDLQSKLGEGTTIKIKIPLTLAIIPALVVTNGGDRYAIPQVSLLELVRLEGEQARKGIEMIHGAPVYRLRGNLLPLVHLGRELETEEQVSGSETGQEGGGVNIVVLQADERTFGLLVEGIHDTEEIVVKPLGKMLKGISAFAGATIMGDGRVALILDVLGLAQKASVVSEVRDRALLEKTEETQERADDRQAFLVFEVGKDRRVAMPLSLVARLEEFESSQIETAGEQEVVQYRGEIMPLIRLAHVLEAEQAVAGASRLALQVVVYSDRGRSVGLVVEQILDIVEERIAIERKAKQKGILGSAVIHERITDLLDVEEVVRTADPSSYQRPLAAGVSS